MARTDCGSLAKLAPNRLGASHADLGSALTLMRACFAFMEGRIDPPGSLNDLTLQGLSNRASSEEVWALGQPLVACMILTPTPDRLYLGKLAVHSDSRGRGLGRKLVQFAETRCVHYGVSILELETRVELTENHATFAALGFRRVAKNSHPGYDHPTSITFRKDIKYI